MLQIKKLSDDKERELTGTKGSLERAQKDIIKKDEIISTLREVSTRFHIKMKSYFYRTLKVCEAHLKIDLTK